METAGVYKITHRPTGLVYVGSSANLRKRKAGHFKALQRGRHHNALLQAQWDQARPEDFAFAVLCMCAPEALLQHEQFYLDAYQAARPGKGFNLAPKAGSCTGLPAGVNQRRLKAAGVLPKAKPVPAPVDAAAVGRVLQYAKLPFFQRESAIAERQAA